MTIQRVWIVRIALFWARSEAKRLPVTVPFIHFVVSFETEKHCQSTSQTSRVLRDVGQTSRNSLARFNLLAGYHQKYRIFLCGCEDSVFKGLGPLYPIKE